MSECCFHTNIINERNPRETPNGQRIPVSRHGGISHVFWGRLARESEGGHSSADTCAGRANGTWRRDHACQDCQRSCGCTGGIAKHALKKSFVSWSASISGGLAGRFCFWRFVVVDRNRAAQIGPINIWAHFFAADGAVCSALDCRAAICRNVSGSILPLRNNRRRHRDFAGQLNHCAWS